MQFLCVLHTSTHSERFTDTGTNHTAAESSGSRSKRSIFPTARIIDPANTEQPLLSSHKAAADAAIARAAEAQQARELSRASSAGPSDISIVPQSPPVSQSFGSQSTSPGVQSDSDEVKEVVKPPKGK